MLLWVSEKYYKAAIVLTIAASLNAVILCIGIVMIIDYLAKIYIESSIHSFSDAIIALKKNIKRILLYAACYLFSFVPFIYNYIMAGKFNLTAAVYLPQGNGIGATLGRMWAYLVDLHLGIFPFYPILLIVGLLLIPFAIYKKHRRYLLMALGFLSTVFAYSFMIHINSGMVGISRYNVWMTPLLLIGIICYAKELLPAKKIIKVSSILAMGLSCIYLAFVINLYGPMFSRNTWGATFAPIPTFVLRHAPSLYNPLPSTFNAHINHVDGGYSYTLPIAYCEADTKYVRKILTSSETLDEVERLYRSPIPEDQLWWEETIAKARNKTGEFYLSIPPNRMIVRNLYLIGDTIYLSGPDRNVDSFIFGGQIASDGWVLNNELILSIYLDPSATTYTATLNISDIVDNNQILLIKQGDTILFNETITSPRPIQFDVEYTGDQPLFLTLQFSNTLSGDETRYLSFVFDSLIFEPLPSV